MKRFPSIRLGAAAWWVVAAAVAGMVRPAAGGADDLLDGLEPDGVAGPRADLAPGLRVAAAFARQRGAEMAQTAKREGLAVPPDFAELLAAAEAGDWPAASNVFGRIRARIGQYEGSTSDPALHNVLWPYALEIAGALEQAATWPPALLERYARDILRRIPDGAIYFGGTDPGRFVIAMYQAVERTPFHVVTQNALADGLYMDFLRRTAREGLALPSADDCAAAFQRYVEDVRAGRVEAGAALTVRDGHVSVEGVQGVMIINGLVARQIVDLNASAPAILVEESYVIPWMYPHLEPDGPILRLHPTPRELTDDTVEADRRFWSEYAASLLAHPDYEGSAAARRTFSKLRAAIAGLYQARGRLDEAERAFRQALELDPRNPEVPFRFARLLAEAGRLDEAESVIAERARQDPDDENARRFLDWIRQTRAQPPPAAADPPAAPE